jgi:hypothetical protein
MLRANSLAKCRFFPAPSARTRYSSVSSKRLSAKKGIHLLSVNHRMDQLFSVLPKVLARRGLDVHAHAAHVVHQSQQWLEGRLPALRDCLRVQKFQDGTVFVTCTHSIAAQECYPLFADLQLFLKQECRFNDIQGIRLTRN